MELYEELLLHKLKQCSTSDDFTNTLKNASSVVEAECYLVLQKIKTIIENDSLDDPECFEKIEQIVRVFEEIGSNGGNRHDFS